VLRRGVVERGNQPLQLSEQHSGQFGARPTGTIVGFTPSSHRRP
jgi:hypothetical protein